MIISKYSGNISRSCQCLRGPNSPAFQFSQRTFWFGRIQNAIRNILSGDDHINPKKILERRYLFLTLLAAHYRSLRLEFPEQDRADLYERATNELDAKGLDRMKNAELRGEMQNALHPQVLELFQAFRRVDESLSFQGKEIEDLDWEPYKSILLNEHEETASSLEKLKNRDNTPATSRSTQFLERKQGALESLLVFHSCLSDQSANVSQVDDFGVDLAGTSDESLELIRRYQTVNMCRSALIKKELGYSVISLKSLIPDAGRGAFVDGTVLTGSLVAFQPGDIWPKEHLLTTAPDVMDHFEGDDDCQISLRFDDYVVDSRQSPVTVLSQEGSMNPFALGHMVNHPPPETLPNCQSTMLNYTERMKLNELLQYVPNTYARLPSWKSRFFEQEEIVMHGLCLVARRDISNEELLYDYRLQSEETPDWYIVVKYGDGYDDQDQVVFFRDDWLEK